MKNKFKSLSKWLGICLCLGALSGLLGAAFSHSVTWATAFRGEHAQLIFLLPFVAPLSVFLYKKLRVEGEGTNQVLLAADGEHRLSWRLIPAVFLGSILSHLFGASVGREGAALQMGGGLSSLFARIFKLEKQDAKQLVYCGMAGLFSAVFGTPLAAALFALEVVFVGQIVFSAAVPALLTSLTAFAVARSLGVHPERFALTEVPQISLSVIAKFFIIVVAGALTSILFCYVLRWSSSAFKKWFKNAYFRIFVGGLLVLAATLLLKTNDYNGAGVHVIEQIFEGGNVVTYAFLVKILLTAVSVGAGFKGGEIVPTLFIGATLGAALASLLGLSLPFGAALGMISLFCGVTNCPLASLVLGLEMFSFKGGEYLLVAVAISFAISGKVSLYSAQKIKGFKKWF